MRSILLTIAAAIALVTCVQTPAFAQAVPIGVRGSVPVCTLAQLTAGTCQLAQPGYLATITNGDAGEANPCAPAAATGSDQITCRYIAGTGWEEFEPGAGGGGGDLGTTATAAGLTITNTGGTNASIPAATPTTWGALTDEDKTKLDGIEAGATADQNSAEVPFTSTIAAFVSASVRAALDFLFASATLDNVPTDRDGDGNPDYIRLTSTTTDALQAAILLLTDSDSQRTVELAPGIYDGRSVAANRIALVSLPARTTLRCQPGAVILGPNAATLATSSGKRLITNSAVVNPADLTALGDSTADPDVHVIGCEARYDLGASYSTSGWTSTNHFGLYFERVEDGVIRNNRITDVVHTCYYLRSTTNVLVDGNTAGDGCGNNKDTAGAWFQQGFYAFASEGADSVGGAWTNNVCEDSGGPCFLTRGEATCIGGSNAGSVCALDGTVADCTVGGGACQAAWVRDLLITGNKSLGGTSGFRVGSARNVSVVGNTATGAAVGIELAGISDGKNLCSGANPSDDANCFNVVSGNTVHNVSTYGIVVQGGNQDLEISGNSIANVGNHCIRMFPPLDRIMVANNVANRCSFDQNTSFATIEATLASAGSTTVSDIVLKGNSATQIGIDVSNRIRGELIEVDYLISRFTAIDNFIRQDTAANFANVCLKIDTVPSSMLVANNHCGLNDEIIPESEAALEALMLGSAVVQEGAPIASTGGAVCQNGVIWHDITASTGGRYACVDGVWTAF